MALRLKKEYKPLPPKKIKTKRKIGIGEKQRAWINVRASLKKEFFDKGITFCQLRYKGCWLTEGLGFAHSKRRRLIKGDEISECILACNFCHKILDEMSHSDTEQIVKQIRAETL